MATRFVQKQSATTAIRDFPNHAGVGVVSGDLYVHDGSVVRKILDAADANFAVGVAASYKVARGQQTTAAAVDTVVTGLTTVVSAVASFDTDPADANLYVSCSIGDQAGAPAAGSIYIKTWKTADGADPTPTAATAFSKKVNWIAIGT